MLRYKALLIIACLAILSSGLTCPVASAQGEYTISLGSGVTADPGQTVALAFAASATDSVAGADILLQFDPALLAYNSHQLQSRFQYVSHDASEPGRLRLILRRHHPDSIYLPPLAPGTDTLALIWLGTSTQDLLADVETPVEFSEDVGTPHDDNRLVKSDSSYVTPPDLGWSHGSVVIRHAFYGDVNDDGYANTIADAIFFVNYLAGIQKFTSRQRANADVNRDGYQAGISDFLELIRLVVEE